MLAPVCGGVVESAERLVGGFANLNFKVRVSGVADPVVVRVYVRDSDAAARETAVLGLVQGSVPAPSVLHVAQRQGDDPAYAVLTWVEGAQLQQVLADLASKDAMRVAHDVGRILAGVQAIRPAAAERSSRPPELPLAPRSIVRFVHESLFEHGGQVRLGVRLTDRFWRFVEEHAQALRSVEDQTLLVHGDFTPFNVLVRSVRGRPKVSAVLDWEYAHLGPPLLDLGTMIRCQRDQFPWFEAPFVSGYAENGGALPDDWRALSQVLDLANLCGLLRSSDTGVVAIRGVRKIVASTIMDRAA